MERDDDDVYNVLHEAPPLTLDPSTLDMYSLLYIPTTSPPIARSFRPSPHPHMHPLPYYPPPFPSHHTQGSSSSSHSSGHTRYSLRGSPGPRSSFPHRHARSSSFGTVSTVSVRSSSPANSVASALTSLSGGASAGAAAPLGSPLATGSPATTFPDTDAPMPFADHAAAARDSTNPPLSMPTAHPALTAYSALLPPPRPPLPDPWPTPHTEYKPPLTRPPHRKQKLANADRKAICMYARQHPNARQEDIAARYNVERSTISKILKNRDRWLGCPDDEAKVARKRKPRFDDLELVLKMWVEDTRDQGLVLSDALIRSKAKEEARQLGISEDKFKASSGWLENFKHRVGIRKGKYVGREQWLGASDDDDTQGAPGAGPSASASASTASTAGPGAGGERIVFMMDQPPFDERAAFEPGPVLEAPAPASVQPQPQPAPVMRKTRSRTLAEAREAAAAASPPSDDPASSAPTTTSAAFVPHGPPSSPLPPLLPDGREASAGLDVALDFIGAQPAGYATPEEVAVLRGLSRRMGRGV